MEPSLQQGESRIPELCKAMNISQSELARQLGVSRQFIHKVKKGEKEFSLAQALNASRILNCTVEDLRVRPGKRTE